MTEARVDDAGIGAAARMGIEVYDQACRNSGRTTRMIMALPENALVLCWEEGRWLAQRIQELRGRNFKFGVAPCKTMDGVMRQISEARAKRVPIAMDHYLISRLYLKELEAFTKRLAEFGIAEHNHSLTTDRPPPASMFKVDDYYGR